MLASMTFAPHSGNWRLDIWGDKGGSYWWTYFPLFADTNYVLWRDFFAQTAFVAVLAAVLVNLRKKTAQKRNEENRHKGSRLLRKIGDFALRAVALCFAVAFSLVGALFVGVLAILAVDLFNKRLADVLFDSPIVIAAIGCLTILCGWLISRACKRKRAIEDEIKIVSSIKIVEPPPPSRVERFFGSEGALERVYNRCFGWIEKIENNRLRTVVGSLIFCVIAFLVGRIAVWALGIRLESYLAMIFLPLFCGYMFVMFATFVGGVVYYAWLAAGGIIKWTGQNLPRGLVFRYRQWKLRHGFVKQPQHELLTVLVAIALIIVFVAALKACRLRLLQF